jgi:HD-GYP domain-containing protein (c-di-GMP phosphodiesterase class II)
LRTCLDQNSNLVRLFGVLKTIVDLGPAATADRDFAETAHDVLGKTLHALDAVQGALFTFDSAGMRLSCVSAIGFDALTLGSDLQIGRPQSQHWAQTREAVILRDNDLVEYFGTQQSEFLGSLRCLMPLRMGSGLVGALCLGSRSQQERYGDLEREALGLLAGHLAMLLQNHTLIISLRHQISDNLRLLSSLDHSFDDALEAFATTIDAKDKHMRGHSMRVGRYSAGIASSLGMNDSEIQSIRAAGQLHDIGRVTVDKAVSNKPSSLRPEEFREIADHTVMGHQIVSSVRFPWPQVPEVVRWHHERADGSGYPDQLRLDELALPVRIVAVSDSFDAMISDRPYRRGMSVLQAAEELVQLTPLKFDSDVVQGLLVQLRCNFDGKNSKTTFGPSGAQITALDLDRLAVQLVHKMTQNRVYSA